MSQEVMSQTSEKPFEGRLQSWEHSRGDKKEYIRLTIDERRYLYFDVDEFNKIKDRMKNGAIVNGAYTESNYTDRFGKDRTSKIIQAVAIKEDAPESEAGAFTPATGVDNVDEIGLMKQCLDDAFVILEQYDAVKWNSEDFRSVAISLFIRRSR